MASANEMLYNVNINKKEGRKKYEHCVRGQEH